MGPTPICRLVLQCTPVSASLRPHHLVNRHIHGQPVTDSPQPGMVSLWATGRGPVSDPMELQSVPSAVHQALLPLLRTCVGQEDACRTEGHAGRVGVGCRLSSQSGIGAPGARQGGMHSPSRPRSTEARRTLLDTVCAGTSQQRWLFLRWVDAVGIGPYHRPALGQARRWALELPVCIDNLWNMRVLPVISLCFCGEGNWEAGQIILSYRFPRFLEIKNVQDLKAGLYQ